MGNSLLVEYITKASIIMHFISYSDRICTDILFTYQHRVPVKTDFIRDTLHVHVPTQSSRQNRFSSKKSLKIPKEQSESANRRRTDNTMAKSKRRKGQTTIYKTLHIELKIE
jgi:hypothetical protein